MAKKVSKKSEPVVEKILTIEEFKALDKSIRDAETTLSMTLFDLRREANRAFEYRSLHLYEWVLLTLEGVDDKRKAAAQEVKYLQDLHRKRNKAAIAYNEQQARLTKK